jgi:hypothetical protein
VRSDDFTWDRRGERFNPAMLDRPSSVTATDFIAVPIVPPSARPFGVICVLAYVALAWSVRFDMRLGEQIASLVYPLDTFSMYGGMPDEDRSHLLIRDRAGAVHRVTAYRSFACEGPIVGRDVPCGGRRGIPYVDEDLMRYMEGHLGPGEEDVELIARTWELRPGHAPMQAPDCIITRCKVSR